MMELSITQKLEDISILCLALVLILTDQIIGLEVLCPLRIFGMNLTQWILLFFIFLIPAFVIGDLLTGTQILKGDVEKIRRDEITLYDKSKDVTQKLFKNLGENIPGVLRINVISRKKDTILTPKDLITQIIDRKNSSMNVKRNIVFASEFRILQSTVQDRVPIKIVKPQLLQSSKGFMRESGSRRRNIMNYLFLLFLVMGTYLLIQFM